MKVRTVVTLDVDPAQVALEYHLDRSEVRQFVKDSVKADADCQWESLGLLVPREVQK